MARAARKGDAHPEEELRGLESSLGQGLAPAYVLRGEERFFRDRAVELVTGAARAAGHELCRHDASDPEFSAATLLDDLAGSSLFASARCIVVHDAPRLLRGSGSEAATAALLARMAGTEEGCIVLVGDSLPATGKVVKAAQKAGGRVASFRKLWETPPPWKPDPRQAEVVLWLVAHARRLRIPLSPDEAVYMVAAVGGDLFALDRELQRLVGREGGQRIGELVGWSGGASPFAVADAMVAGDAARAVAGIESLFQAGFRGRDGSRTLDAGGLVAILVGAIGGKLRESLAGARALEAGAGEAGARAAAGVKGGPAAVRSFDQRLERRSAKEWSRMNDELGDLERRTRTGALVDAGDFALLALRWRSRTPARR